MQEKCVYRSQLLQATIRESAALLHLATVQTELMLRTSTVLSVLLELLVSVLLESVWASLLLVAVSIPCSSSTSPVLVSSTGAAQVFPFVSISMSTSLSMIY